LLLLWIASLALAMTNLEVAYAAFCQISENLFYVGAHTRYDATGCSTRAIVIGSTSSRAIAMPHCNAHLSCICNFPEKPNEHAD
jgi:hypothetical protein